MLFIVLDRVELIREVLEKIDAAGASDFVVFAGRGPGQLDGEHLLAFSRLRDMSEAGREGDQPHHPDSLTILAVAGEEVVPGIVAAVEEVTGDLERFPERGFIAVVPVVLARGLGLRTGGRKERT